MKRPSTTCMTDTGVNSTVGHFMSHGYKRSAHSKVVDIQSLFH